MKLFLDLAAEDLAAFIRWVMRDVTYHKHYTCTVQGQHADGLLDLLPDDETIKGTGLSAVKIKHGLPGARAFVKAGARVMLSFENGDPKKPRAHLWDCDADGVVSIELPGDRRPLARKGDPVVVFLPALPAGAIVGGGVLPNGTPFTFTNPPVPPMQVSGIITDGNERVLG